MIVAGFEILDADIIRTAVALTVGFIGGFFGQYYWKNRLMRASKLYEDRQLTIKTLFQRLVEMEQAAQSYFSPLQQDDKIQEKEENAVRAINEFIGYSTKSEIFFKENEWKMIEDITNTIKRMFNKFVIYKPHDLSLATDIKDLKEKHKIWGDVWEEIHIKIPVLKNLLKTELQKTMGF